MKKTTSEGSSKRKSDWISSSFGEFSEFSSSQTLSQKSKQTSKKHEYIDLTESCPDLSTEYTPWIEKYKPNIGADLAVHKKKVLEVKQWVQNHFHSHGDKNDVGILLLSGPAGSGKTAVVDVLARELECELKEWINPVGHDYQEKSSENWRDFLAQKDSQTQQFSDFLLRANRYTGLNMVGSEQAERKEKKIVSIEDLPNFAIWDPKKLHCILRQYLSAGRSPVVIIMSDTHNTDASVHAIFPKNIQQELGIVNISFNAIATTTMTRTINKIVSAESELTENLIIPSKDTYELLATSSNGDIRSCINSLQFYCTNCYPTEAKIRKKPIKSKKKSQKNPKSDKEHIADENISFGGRDTSLFLFRSLGKILYCKRTRLKEDERLSQLPPHLKQHTRDIPQVDPENVFERTQVTSDTFTLYLHQNYPDFFADIDDLAASSMFVTDADIMSGIWSSRNVMSDYSSSVAMRGIMFCNRSSHSPTGAVAGGWRPLHKPQWFESFKTRNQRIRSGKVYFQEAGYSSKDLYTEVLPLLNKLKTQLKGPGHNAFVQEVSTFSIGRQSYRPNLQTLTDGATEPQESSESRQNCYETKQMTYDSEDSLFPRMDEEDTIEDFDDD